MRRSKVILVALSVLVLLASQSIAMAYLISNGDFETGDLTDWTITGGNALVAEDGGNNFAVTIETVNPIATLSHDVCLHASDQTIDFDYGLFDSDIPSIDIFQVWLYNGTDSLALFQNGFTFAPFVTLATIDLTAFDVSAFLGGPISLNFSIIGQDDPFVTNAAFLLDNVKINGDAPPVPEPATLLLVGAGLFGLGLQRYRRKHHP